MDWFLKHWVETLCGGVTAAMGFLFRRVMKKWKATVAAQEAMKKGIMALLRDRIIQAYYHHMDRGYCPVESRDSVLSMYAEYTALGGNGNITDLVNKLRALPTKKENASWTTKSTGKPN